jgi:hypothetical protein
MTPAVRLRRLAPLLLIALALCLHWSYFKWRIRVATPGDALQVELPMPVDWSRDTQDATLQVREWVYAFLFVRDGQHLAQAGEGYGRLLRRWHLFPQREAVLWVATDQGFGPQLTTAGRWLGLYLPLLLVLAGAVTGACRLRTLLTVSARALRDDWQAQALTARGMLALVALAAVAVGLGNALLLAVIVISDRLQ